VIPALLTCRSVNPFAGLDSVERTEQEDVLLAIFNAAISNATLFKIDYSLGRDTQDIFSRSALAPDYSRSPRWPVP
jgi:hypothetical protein